MFPLWFGRSQSLLKTDLMQITRKKLGCYCVVEMLCACEPPVNLSGQVVSVLYGLKCHRLVYLTQRLLWRPGLVYLTQ